MLLQAIRFNIYQLHHQGIITMPARGRNKTAAYSVLLLNLIKRCFIEIGKFDVIFCAHKKKFNP